LIIIIKIIYLFYDRLLQSFIFKIIKDWVNTLFIINKKKKNYILGTIKNIEIKGFGPFLKKN